jgi:hypothetical protein
MAWYDNNSKLSHVETYKNEKDASKDAEKAAKKGWMPQGTTATDGHINVGRTVTGAVLTGGLSLLIGGSRSKGKITLSYVRTPGWLEEHQPRVKAPKVVATTTPQVTSAMFSEAYPVAKLKQLKDMLDTGLISQEEYDKTKTAILARM